MTVRKPRSSTPRPRERLDDHAHLVVVLAADKARAVRGRPDLDEQDRGVGQRRDLQHTAMLTDVLEPVADVQNGHSAFRPASSTAMAVNVASVKPPSV